MQPKGGYTLLYFVKSKNDTKCKNFVDLLCSYVNTFILLYFLRFQEGGGYSPLSPPPKSATGYSRKFSKGLIFQIFLKSSVCYLYLVNYGSIFLKIKLFENTHYTVSVWE